MELTMRDGVVDAMRLQAHKLLQGVGGCHINAASIHAKLDNLGRRWDHLQKLAQERYISPWLHIWFHSILVFSFIPYLCLVPFHTCVWFHSILMIDLPMKRRLSVTHPLSPTTKPVAPPPFSHNLISESNLQTFRLNAPVVRHQGVIRASSETSFTLMTTGAFTVKMSASYFLSSSWLVTGTF